MSQALAAIDAVNAEDPTSIRIDDRQRPKELAHGELMTRWVQDLDPSADEAQQIAARAHHLRRWALPRTDFPAGRSGYLRWRKEQRRRHAVEVTRILTEIGYDPATIDRVDQIVTKRGLGPGGTEDKAVQTHEDALCLTFLATQLDDLAHSLGPERTVEVLEKTVAKMSGSGLAKARTLALSPEAERLLTEALHRSEHR